MKDITLSQEHNGILLKQDSIKDSVFVYLEDLPELVKQIEEFVKKKEEESKKLTNVTIRDDWEHCITFEQSFDGDIVQVDRADIPKLITLLQGMVKK